MTRTKVTSSHIRSVGYEPTSGTLHIEFNSGHVYEYKGVDEHYYQALMDSKSNGSAFHTYIKPNFKGVKL